MLLKGLVIIVSTFIVGVAILAYSPLPEGIDDPFKVLIQIGGLNVMMKIIKLKEYLGYGSLYKNFNILGEPPKTEIPFSAANGDLKVTRDQIAGVPVIVYQHKDTSVPHPAIVYFHGGGWVMGSPDTHDQAVYKYALETHAVAINVGYRMAPKHPFPASIQDCLDVTRYILRHGIEYNIDATRVGVAGDSAGGNLAAAVALALTREKSDLPPLLFQILHYPALQAFDMHLPSHVDLNQSAPVLSQHFMSALYAYYMGADIEDIDHYTAVISANRHIPARLRKSKYGEFVNVKLLPAQYQKPKTSIEAAPTDHDEKVYAKIKDVLTNPLFSPLMSPDLTGLPPTFIHVCEFDILRDDGLLYARRLQDAGVKTELHFGKGGFHGDATINMITFMDLQPRSGKVALSAAYQFVRSILEQ
uniref:Alpha/beta hydrolase fold-3 domain-containing protein n=1 Tax=Arion vulgaris TaxID=1028688 RepID=A0A0B7B0U4_9EUPU